MNDTGQDEPLPWHWNWSDMCPTGLTPWIPDTNDLAPCFQQMCLQLPVLVFISIFSSYHFGRQATLVARDKTQIGMLYLRVTAVLALAFVPLLKTYMYLADDMVLFPSDILVSCTECVTWVVHLGFLLSLRSHGGQSHRGSLFLGVLWSTAVMVSVVWFHTSLSYAHWQWSLIVPALHIFYGISLIPSGQSRIINRRDTEEDERQALLGNHYIRFQDYDNEVLGPAQDIASLYSKFIFAWVKPLIEKGVLGLLKNIDDLFDLPECLNVTRITGRFQRSIENTRSLFRALHRSFGREFYGIGILRLIADLSGFAGPLLLGQLLKYDGNEEAGSSLPYLYALGLFMSALLSTFCSTHFSWKMAMVSMKMRMGLVTALYRKTLETKGLQGVSPDILNLMSTDTDRIVNSCVSFHSFWSIPFQLFTTLYLLYTQIGVAFLAGVIFAVTLIPINRYIAIKIGELSNKLMQAKDARVSASTEALNGAKQIKLHAWEEVFITKIEGFRKEEVKYLSKRKYLDALCVYFWATTPVLMCLLTFGGTLLMGNKLTASATYTSVALLNMLIGPLNSFPWVLNGLTEAWVSLCRVQQVIDLTNFDMSSYYSSQNPSLMTPHKHDNKIVVAIRNGNFEYQNIRKQTTKDTEEDEKRSDFKLQEINLLVRKGELISITGPVGSGKSTLLATILGDLTCTSGEIFVQDLASGFGYVAQSPWLQRGTIRDNIIWGTAYEETRYRNVLYACALLEDLEDLGGDLIGVGEAGRTLSGGQRARVALARAVYQDKSVYLLDDVLSALDAHVANHVIKYCIFGLLKTKTRLIVSEHKSLLQYTTQIINMDNGKAVIQKVDPQQMSENQSLDGDDRMANINLSNADDKTSVHSVMLEETKEHGTLSLSVLRTYWNAMSTPLAIIVIVSVICMQVSRNLSDIWLARFVGADSTLTTESFLEIYSGFAIANSILTLARAFVFAYAGIRAAKYIHRKLTNSVFYTKFQFFDIVPLGRILNRFSSDTYTIDDSLPFILNILLAQFFGLLGSIAISVYAMPWLVLLVVPLSPVYLSLQNRYRHASRDIKRLGSNALSPLYAHFTETLQGLTTIRAMRGANRFRMHFAVKLEESIRAQMTACAAQQWLGLRLQMLGAMLIGGAGLLSAITSAHATNPSLVGLAISYALSITSLLAGLLNAVAETEQELVAVERVNQYCNLDKEVNANGSADSPFGWPCQGVVTFKDVFLKYRPNSPNVLTNISFETISCEKVGIVGRTGAGKSSILAGLLRTVPLSMGTINIDCVNIATLPLAILRDRIAVVPQDSFLFNGKIRENLDPCNRHTEDEIVNALRSCLSLSFVQALGGLDARLDDSGGNLSAGQKQLLCLSRALLKNSKVVCIDEGTANLDVESEQTIQSVLRTAFKTSTVLFIAHRLNGLQHADRIIVMSHGNIVEMGSPGTLGNDSASQFHNMLEEQMNREYKD